MGIEHHMGVLRALHHCALPCLPEVTGGARGTGTWSIPHVALPWNASENFFLRRMSSRSGEDRSGRKGTKTGLGADEPAFGGEARFGWGACMGAVVRMMGPGVCAALEAWGYCEGGAGLGRRPELLVNGWVARGSKEERTELDMAMVGVSGGGDEDASGSGARVESLERGREEQLNAG